MGVEYRTASSVSKMLLPEQFTGSNGFESYLTHFELLADLQNWKCTVSGAKNDERLIFLALRSQKSAIKFYHTLSDSNRNSFDDIAKAFILKIQWFPMSNGN